jgi:hypothetical protein
MSGGLFQSRHVHICIQVQHLLHPTHLWHKRLHQLSPTNPSVSLPKALTPAKNFLALPHLHLPMNWQMANALRLH